MKNEAKSDWKPVEVIELGSANFTDWILSNKLSLIEFYSPSCGHCKRLARDYELAAKALSKESINLAKVDTTVETDLSTTYNITALPGLLVFRYDHYYEYKGDRRSAGETFIFQNRSFSKLI